MEPPLTIQCYEELLNRLKEVPPEPEDRPQRELKMPGEWRSDNVEKLLKWPNYSKKFPKHLQPKSVYVHFPTQTRHFGPSDLLKLASSKDYKVAFEKF